MAATRTATTVAAPGASTACRSLGALDFRAVHALDARRAWLMSSGDADKGQARIYRTTDAGSALDARLLRPTRRESSSTQSQFWDAQHGIAISDPVDGRFFMLTTNDGGGSWSRIPPERIPAALAGEAAFAASGSCLTVEGESNVWIGTGGGATARVYHSPDRGRTWTVAETPIHAGNASSGIFSLAFRDGRHGVAVGGDYQMVRGGFPNVALTDDGGRTWRVAKGPLPIGYLSSTSFVPGSSTVVAVGLAGTAFSNDNGESWRWSTPRRTTPCGSSRRARAGRSGRRADSRGGRDCRVSELLSRRVARDTWRVESETKR